MYLERYVGGDKGGFVAKCGWLDAKLRLIDDTVGGVFLNGGTTYKINS